MFVAENTLKEIKNYFNNSLDNLYPESEIGSFFNILCDSFLGFSRSDIQLKLNSHLSESELLKFHYAIKDLKQFKPVQYITGSQYFYENDFLVNEHTLIPRPETEELVDLIIKENPEPKLRVLDIGTGSGAISISLSLFLKESEVIAFDVSENALELAKTNSMNLDSSVDFQLVDILNPDYLGMPFDIIVSNPPYVLEKEKEKMESNVLEFEPHLALFVEDDDPLIFYKKIVDFCGENLNSGGRLYFEINEKYGYQVLNLLGSSEFDNLEIIKDLSNKDRIVKGIKK